MAVRFHLGGALRLSRNVVTLRLVPPGVCTVIDTVSGIHGVRDCASSSPGNGSTSTRQLWPADSPEIVPVVRLSRSGRPLSITRAVSTRTKWSSSACVPRTVAPTNDPIDTKMIEITAKVTTTSMSVKPAEPCEDLKRIKRHNFNASREPIDANLVAYTKPG